jgi:hypothetical protein
MATTPVTLKVDGYKDREVYKVNYSFDQATDAEGQIAGIPRGGKITINIKALNDGNNELLKWMTTPDLGKNGSLYFKETKTGNKMKEIKFDNAYCISFQEDWEDKVGHTETITLSCQKITNGTVVYENAWA